MKKSPAFLSDEVGASAVEYGLMAALIAGAIIATVSLIGIHLDGFFEKFNQALLITAP